MPKGKTRKGKRKKQSVVLFCRTWAELRAALVEAKNVAPAEPAPKQKATEMHQQDAA